VAVLIPSVGPVIGSGVWRGAAHRIDLTLTLALDGTDGVVDDLLRRADAAVNFVVPDGLDLEALALKFVPVEERHGRLLFLLASKGDEPVFHALVIRLASDTGRDELQAARLLK